MCCCREAACVLGGNSPSAASVSKSKRPKGGTPLAPIPVSVCLDGLSVRTGCVLPGAVGDSALPRLSGHIIVPVPPR